MPWSNLSLGRGQGSMGSQSERGRAWGTWRRWQPWLGAAFSTGESGPCVRSHKAGHLLGPRVGQCRVGAERTAEPWLTPPHAPSTGLSCLKAVVRPHPGSLGSSQ